MSKVTTNPQHPNPYLKSIEGWATITELNSNSVLNGTLSASGAGFNHFYRYQNPNVSTEYFLIENRQKTGWDFDLPADGIAVWHIDELGSPANESLVPNTTHQNYKVSLIQADNLWHFQNYVNKGDVNDLYYAGNTAAAYTNRFNDTSAPDANWWDGSSSGLRLSNFSAKARSLAQTLPKRLA